MADLTNCLIAAGTFLGLTLVYSLMKAKAAGRRDRREIERNRLAVPAAAKILAAETGSRMNVNDWTGVLFDFHRAGFSLDESLDLAKRLRVFWN